MPWSTPTNTEGQNGQNKIIQVTVSKYVISCSRCASPSKTLASMATTLAPTPSQIKPCWKLTSKFRPDAKNEQWHPAQMKPVHKLITWNTVTDTTYWSHCVHGSLLPGCPFSRNPTTPNIKAWPGETPLGVHVVLGAQVFAQVEHSHYLNRVQCCAAQKSKKLVALRNPWFYRSFQCTMQQSFSCEGSPVK